MHDLGHPTPLPRRAATRSRSARPPRCTPRRSRRRWRTGRTASSSATSARSPPCRCWYPSEWGAAPPFRRLPPAPPPAGLEDALEHAALHPAPKPLEDGPVTAKACETANASGTAQDQWVGRGAVLAGRLALRRAAPRDGVAKPGFPPLGTGACDRKRVL